VDYLKIAVCSDIHGNAAALAAVLADIDRRNPDLIFCGGDLVGYGAFPTK
jgi:predicted phosphodiesterase